MKYDGAEIQVCIELPSQEEAGFERTTNVEALGDDSQESERTAEEAVASGQAIRWFFTVYWHLKEGGVKAIADFEERADAEDLFNVLKAGMKALGESRD